MPDDVGGKPFPDGWEPDDDRGGADEDFASVVFDEDFVRSAPVHEPTAVERLLAAA
uniref:SCO2584 family spore wall biosynthesis protein n=2 Tax=Streptomyces TaxID=1883 RepID=UPI000AEF2297